MCTERRKMQNVLQIGGAVLKQEQIVYLKKLWQELEQAGDELRNKPMPELNEKDFYLFKETGNRLVYEEEYFGRRKYLTVFGILAEFGAKRKDIDKLTEVIHEICQEKFWALPAHVNFNALDEKTIDLFAAETAQSLMELLVIMEDKMPGKMVEFAAEEVVDRVLLPFCQSRVPHSWWETDRCNWAAVCAGSIGMAAIYLDRLQKKEEGQDSKTGIHNIVQKLPVGWKQSVIDRVCNALQCYLDGMEEDGACTEGLGYYAYGMSYYTAFAELLYEETNGKIDLMRKPKCDKIALFQQKCYFGGGISISFSDGSAHEYFLPGLTAYLKECYPKVISPDYLLARPLDGDACYRWLTNERNIRWLMQYEGKIPYEKQPEVLAQILADKYSEERTLRKEYGKTLMEWTYDLFPSAQWMICRDAQGNGYAAKGGNNDENHNHNDVGHFMCVYEGEMLLTDLGAGEYTKGYFSEQRYEILCNRSLGHSVPLINGMEQCAGGEYAADAFIWDESKRMLTISFAKAYPQGCIDSLIRQITMEDKKDADSYAMCVTDTFVPNGETREIVENLITVYRPVVDKNHILIEGQKGRLKIEISGMEQNGQIRVIPQKHSNHAGKEQTIYLLQWQISLDEWNVQTKIRIVGTKKQ